MPEGVDYAFGRPTPATLNAAGVRFVCRYLSHSPAKNLTAAEARALSDAGLWIVAVWETTAQRALDGRKAGAADAAEALAQAQACGMPAGRPVYFAVDWDASSDQQAAINAYLDGAASVLGRAHVGIYGGYGPVSRALDAGTATWAWQTYAWSESRWDPRAQLQQYSNDHLLGGVGCDYDRATKTDYGQWRAGASPATEEDNMAQVSALGVNAEQTIDAGKAADIAWTKEYSDRHGLHGDGGTSVVIAKESLWAVMDAQFMLHGLPRAGPSRSPGRVSRTTGPISMTPGGRSSSPRTPAASCTASSAGSSASTPPTASGSASTTPAGRPSRWSRPPRWPRRRC